VGPTVAVVPVEIAREWEVGVEFGGIGDVANEGLDVGFVGVGMGCGGWLRGTG